VINLVGTSLASDTLKIMIDLLKPLLFLILSRPIKAIWRYPHVCNY
jgi:hypothetical protein